GPGAFRGEEEKMAFLISSSVTLSRVGGGGVWLVEGAEYSGRGGNMVSLKRAAFSSNETASFSVVLRTGVLWFLFGLVYEKAVNTSFPFASDRKSSHDFVLASLMVLK